jgi:hypothetical protein
MTTEFGAIIDSAECFECVVVVVVDEIELELESWSF